MAKTERPAKQQVSSQKEKKFELPPTMELGTFLHLYEYVMLHKPMSDFRTWPDVTFEQAYELVKDVKYNIVSEEPKSFLAESVLSTDDIWAECESTGHLDLARLQKSMIDRKCCLGFSIPLIQEIVGREYPIHDSLKITFLYQWVNTVRRANEIQRREQVRAAALDKVNVHEFEIEIECTLDQAQLLEGYFKVQTDAYNSWHAQLLKDLKSKAKKTAYEPASTLVTAFRKEYSGKVPRTLITRGMRRATFLWQAWLDSGRSAAKKPEALSGIAAMMTLADTGFKWEQAGSALVIGETSPIHVASVLRGTIQTERRIKYISVKKRDGLFYTVTGVYRP